MKGKSISPESYLTGQVNKKIKKTDLSVTERRFGVVLEDINSKLDLVVEGHQGLDKKIDKNHEEFRDFRKEVNYKFDVVFEKFDEVDYKFGVVFEKFDEIDVQFKNVDTQFSDVKDELRVIRNELKEKVGRDELALLEKRVMALEKSRK